MQKQLLILLLLLISSCAAYTKEAELKVATLNRAAFDLDCPKEEIEITKLQEEERPTLWGPKYLDEVMYGASGCGNKITYQARNGHMFGEALVYKEGAAPNHVIVQGVLPTKPSNNSSTGLYNRNSTYKTSPHYSPYKRYQY